MAPAEATPTPIRLNRYLAECGVASRRKADELISKGHVQINGKRVTDLGTRVNPKQDHVVLDNKVVKPDIDKVYLMFHKPENVLTTLSDPEGRLTIADYMRKFKRRVFPVGRLDWDTEGLLLLTNDGEFAQRVAHPSEKVTKTYMAKVSGQPSVAQLEKLKRGVSIPGGGRVHADHIERVKKGSKAYDWILLVITEGKNRQVRHMFQKIGYDVLKLRRVSIGGLRLGSLRKGEFQWLTPKDAAKVFEMKHVREKRVGSDKKRG